MILGFLKNDRPLIDDVEATGTYADGAVQLPKSERPFSQSRERGHVAYERDYGSDRKIVHSFVGFV